MYRVYANDPTARINLGIRRRLAPLLAQQPAQDRAAQYSALLDAGHAGALLRRRNRDGRQFLSRRSQRLSAPRCNGARDRNAGFSKANPQQLYLPITIDPEYHYEAINVENQQKNLSSLLWWMRRVIAMRKNFKAFSRGSHRISPSGKSQGARLSAAVRRRDDSRGRESCRASRSRSRSISRVSPVACSWRFSARIYFPPIKKSPYSDHARTARRITGSSSSRRTEQRARRKARRAYARRRSRICRRSSPTGSARRSSARFCRTIIRTCRWFGAKARTIRELRIIEQMPMFGEGDRAVLVSRSRLTPTARRRSMRCRCRSRPARRQMRSRAMRRNAVIARFVGAQRAVLHDAIWDADFREQLFRMMASGATLEGQQRRPRRRGQHAAGAGAERQSAGFAGAQCRAEQFVDVVRKSIFPEALPQARGWRESRRGGDAIPDRAAPICRMCRRLSARSNIAVRGRSRRLSALLQTAACQRRRCLDADARCGRSLLTSGCWNARAIFNRPRRHPVRCSRN